jgi:hypothetical protein
VVTYSTAPVAILKKRVVLRALAHRVIAIASAHE